MAVELDMNELHRIAKLEAEAESLARGSCRNEAERSLQADRVASIRRLIDGLKSGALRPARWL